MDGRADRRPHPALKGLNNRPRSFKDRKTVSKAVVQTLKNREFSTAKEFRAGLASNECAEVLDAGFVQAEECVAGLHLGRSVDPFDAVALSDEIRQAWYGDGFHGTIVRQIWFDETGTARPVG